MPLTKFKLSSIADDGITSQKLAHDLDFDGQFVRVPHGTTAQRPSSPAAGYLRFNTTLGTLEQYNTNTSNWAAIDSPPVITSVAYAGAITAADPAGGDTITITGSNFKSGLTVTVGGTAAASVSFTNTTTITFVTPVKTAGDYDVAITNPNGLTATSTNGISFNGIPSWTTSAGQLGSTLLPSQAISTMTIVASEPDGGAQQPPVVQHRAEPRLRHHRPGPGALRPRSRHRRGHPRRRRLHPPPAPRLLHPAGERRSRGRRRNHGPLDPRSTTLQVRLRDRHQLLRGPRLGRTPLRRWTQLRTHELPQDR